MSIIEKFAGVLFLTICCSLTIFTIGNNIYRFVVMLIDNNLDFFGIFNFVGALIVIAIWSYIFYMLRPIKKEKEE